VTRILVALDDGEGSLHAARTARELFGGPDTDVLGINVATLPQAWIAPGVGYGMVTPVFPPAVGDAVETVSVRQAEARAAAVLEESGLADATALGAIGDPVAAIVAAAVELDVDVIVVGGDEAGFLGRLLDQSVSRALLRDAGRPVLVVPPAPDESSAAPTEAGR
jgi:nucleotide-binding universal stress UspA family protein